MINDGRILLLLLLIIAPKKKNDQHSEWSLCPLVACEEEEKIKEKKNQN